MNDSFQNGASGRLILCCDSRNDLFVTLQQMGVGADRFSTPHEAVERAERDGNVLILADGYPTKRTEIPGDVLAEAAAKGLRVFVEFPEMLPGVEIGKIREAKIERVVVASDVFGSELEKLRILGLHGCRYVPVSAAQPSLVVARVAGFDSAVFGLPEEAQPILFELEEIPSARPEMLVATTKLSQFVTARYAPAEAWATIWKTVFLWLSRGEIQLQPVWTPLVAPRFSADEQLPENVEEMVLRDGVRWFSSSRLLMHPSWADKWDEAAEYHDRVWEGPAEDWLIGDGTEGLLEGFSSNIDEKGRQKIRWYLRGDCNAEAAMAHAFAAKVQDDDNAAKIAQNLLDFVFFRSNLTKGPRADVNSASYGLIGWDTREDGAVVYYGDDNAKLLMAAGAAASLLDDHRWDESMVRAILGNFRTSGRLGFRKERLEEKDLSQVGWESHFLDSPTHLAPHFECWLWACYLWLYRHTGFELLLERSRLGLKTMMEAYPDNWHWTNGLQQERARMLIPLAWLVRVDDRPEHREWLARISEDLLASQQPCGAIREEVGSAGTGKYAPPISNEEYGTTEAPLVQRNGDPLADLLYTANFAFPGLREAAAAGDERCVEAENKLAEFLCRVQIRSEERPEFDGAWFRAVDFERWEYWASDADSGWGAWSIETGWTQGWICGGLGLRLENTSIWDLLEEHRFEEGLFERLRKEMLPDEVLAKL